MHYPANPLHTILTQHMDEIVQRWVASQKTNAHPAVDDGELETEARLILDELIRAINEGVPNLHDDTDMVALLTQLSQHRARQGSTPQDTTRFLLALRAAFLPVLLRESSSDLPRQQSLLATFCALLDDLTLATFEIHLRNRMGMMVMPLDPESDAFPLLEPWPGLLAFPVDEAWLTEAQGATRLLEAVATRRVRVLLLDFTELRQMSEEAAPAVVQTIRALRLLKVTPLLMGLSAPVAHALALAGLEPG